MSFSRRAFAASLAALPFAASPVRAQSFPAGKTVKLIVPFLAGAIRM